jgi:hypothetical protein
MHEALAHIRSWNGHQVYLQVQSDNDAALALYRSLAFEERGEVRRWQATLSRLRLPPPEHLSGHRTRPLKRREWRAARQLDRQGFAPDLNWPAPPAPDYYKKGLLQKIGDLLNGRHQETWVIDQENGSQPALIGLADIVSEWGRPHRLRLCVPPEWRGTLDGALLYTSVARLRRYRGGSLWLDHPATGSDTDALLEACNFQLRRSLTVMRKNLGSTNPLRQDTK